MAAALGITSAALFACAPPHPHDQTKAPLRQISGLDCPPALGDLSLTTHSPDGSACAYASSDGDDQVNLTLMKVSGADATASLAPIEAELKSDMPNARQFGASAGTGGGDWNGDKDRVNIDLPGLHIHSGGNGHAVVDTAGVHVAADGSSDDGHPDDAHVVVSGTGHAGVTVDAHEGSAQIRVDESGPGVRVAYVLESDQPGPAGWRLAAYEARGPAQGPIVVARILSKRRHADDLRHEVRDLLKANVGG